MVPKFREHLRRAQQRRNVAVVAAQVCRARVHRLVRRAAHVVHGQRVHLGPERHRAVVLCSVSCQQADDACLPHTGTYSDSQPFELVGAHFGSAVLLVPDLGMSVQVFTNFPDTSRNLVGPLPDKIWQ